MQCAPWNTQRVLGARTSCPLSAIRREKKIEWQPLEIDEPPLAGTAGIPACNERFSAKRGEREIGRTIEVRVKNARSANRYRER
jgi:hypothetical protein